MSSSRLFFLFCCVVIFFFSRLSGLAEHTNMNAVCNGVVCIFPVLLVNWNFAHKYSRNFCSFFSRFFVINYSRLLHSKKTQKIEQFSVLFMNLSVIFIYSSLFQFVLYKFLLLLLLSWINRGCNKFLAAL